MLIKNDPYNANVRPALLVRKCSERMEVLKILGTTLIVRALPGF